MQITRRAALRGGTAAVAAIAGAGVTTKAIPREAQAADTELFTLVSEWERVDRQEARIYGEYCDAQEAYFPVKRAGGPAQALGHKMRAAEQRHNEIVKDQSAVEAQIIETPAHTIDGILVKLRIVGYWIKTMHSNEHGVLEGAEIEDRLALSALADLESLVGRVES